MAQKIQIRRDTAANWTAANPVLAQGEPGHETDTGYVKYGNGVSAWNSLTYMGVGDIGFTQSGTGAVPRTIEGKLKDVVSVKDFGAVGNGVADDTAAFSAAAQGAPAAVNIVGAEGTLPRAPMCRVLVPAGTYVLTSEVNTGNREVVWVVDQAATISGYSFINGELLRLGQRQADYHHGTTDYACTQSFRSNTDLEDGAEVLGIQSATELATYTDRDTVGLFVDNAAPAALVNVGTATYTSTTVTIAAPSTSTLRRYRRGMIIDTKHSPKWSGIVDSWNTDGSVLTVTAWYQVGGGGTPGTPANGTGCVINGFTKAWAHNANIFLNSNSYASRAAGFELGVLNDKGVLNYANQTNFIWGFDAVSLGTYEGAVGFITRPGPTSKFYRGFACDDATSASFYTKGTPGAGFWSEQTSGDPFRYDKNGTLLFAVTGNGEVLMPGAGVHLSLGSSLSVNSPYIDFNSSGNAVDYDVRIRASAGTASPGNGVLTITAGDGVRTDGPISSVADNTHQCGTPARRWTEVYAASGVINTSDERDKQDIASLDEAEQRVAVAIKGLVKKFRFKSAVQAKGENARIHVGVIAQEVVAAFAAEGLDATRYGILCYDEWQEAPEIVESWEDKYDIHGNFIAAGSEVVQAYQPAGNRYGIRYEELLAFVLAAL